MTIKEYALINRQKPFKANGFKYNHLEKGSHFVRALKLYSKNVVKIPRDKKEII